MRFRAKCCGGIKVYTPAALALTGPLGEAWAGISFLLLPQQTSLWRRFLGIDSSEIKEMPKIFGNQLQPPLLGWKPINNITSYERTDAFLFVHLLRDIIFLCKYSQSFFSCPGQLNKWHCRSVGLSVGRSEPTINQSLGSIKEWPSTLVDTSRH